MAMATALGFASCGTKKEKARAALTNAAQMTGQGDGDDVFENETEATTDPSQVMNMTRHRYELYDYNGLSINGINGLLYTYSKNHFTQFRELRRYLVDYYKKNCKTGDELNFYNRIQHDGTSKYVDKNDKEITDQTIIKFFSDNVSRDFQIVSAIRFCDTGSNVTLNIDFVLPSFVGDIDYVPTFSAMYDAMTDEETALSSPDTLFAKKFNEGWLYITTQNKAAKIKVIK